MIFLAEAHDNILESGHTLALKVEDGPTQHLGQIKH
jgi:hypothetical protein